MITCLAWSTETPFALVLYWGFSTTSISVPWKSLAGRPGTYRIGPKACHNDESLDACLTRPEQNVFDQRPAIQFDQRFGLAAGYGDQPATVSGGEDQSSING